MRTSILSALAYIFAIAICGGPPPALAQGAFGIGERKVLPCFEKEFHFFEQLKLPVTKWGEPKPGATPQWNVDRLMEYFSDDRILYTDVNDVYGERVITRAALQEALTERKGLAYEILTGMARRYSTPYKQYSQLTFMHRDDGTTIVDMAGSHKVTFRIDGSKRVVTRIEYLVEPG